MRFARSARVKPSIIMVVDNRPDLRGCALGGWADDHGVQFCFINPGKPTQNSYIASVDGRGRAALRQGATGAAN